MQKWLDEKNGSCCLNNTHTTHYSDGYSTACKMHGTSRTTDTGWSK